MEKMEKMVAFCGLSCSECLALLATKADDNQKRIEVAELWSKQFNADIKPEYINCHGCKTEGDKLFGYCKICEIRKCGMEKKIENCAYCEDYLCDKLSGFVNMAPQAKKNLEDIRANI